MKLKTDIFSVADYRHSGKSDKAIYKVYLKLNSLYVLDFFLTHYLRTLPTHEDSSVDRGEYILHFSSKRKMLVKCLV